MQLVRSIIVLSLASVVATRRALKLADFSDMHARSQCSLDSSPSLSVEGPFFAEESKETSDSIRSKTSLEKWIRSDQLLYLFKKPTRISCK